MKTSKKINRLGYILTAVGLFMAVLLPSTNLHKASAAGQIGNRKLIVSSSANGNVSNDIAGNAVNPGDGGNGAKAKHTVIFDLGTSGATTGGIVLMYCTTPVPGTTCTTPTGMSANNLTSVTVSGLNATSNFALDTTTSNATITGCNGSGTTRDNCVFMKRGTAQTETGTPTATVVYGGGSSNYIKNPTTDNSTFFIRITVYATTAYGTAVDQGTVASSTAQQIDITAKVQEKLKFSVASIYTAPGANCVTPLDDSGQPVPGAVALGDVDGVLDSATQYDAHSYFRLATNAINGTTVYYSGDTLKSGSNDINALTSETVTAAGSEQFGLANDSGDTGKYSFAGGATGLSQNTSYDEGNGLLGTAKFNYAVGSVTTPVALASSSSVVICDTGSVRYVGNIATTTPAGIYTTTITYIAVPAF
jgi:hypothetical protein